MANNKRSLRVESIEILFGWFLLGIAAFLHLTSTMDFDEKTAIWIPAILGVTLFKVLFDSVSNKLIQTDNLILKNLFSLFSAIAIIVGISFVVISKMVQLPHFISARFTMLCSVVYTCLVYFSGRKNGLLRQRFYGYLTLILLIILNLRSQGFVNRSIVLLITIGFANLILPIVAIIKSEKH